MSENNHISFTDFDQVNLRSGTIVKVENFDRARKPAYKVWVDFGGDIGIKQTSAQITTYYKMDELIGVQVMGCVNLPPKNIAGFMSEFLLTGFEDDNGAICLATIKTKVPNGRKLC